MFPPQAPLCHTCVAQTRQVPCALSLQCSAPSLHGGVTTEATASTHRGTRHVPPSLVRSTPATPRFIAFPQRTPPNHGMHNTQNTHRRSRFSRGNPCQPIAPGRAQAAPSGAALGRRRIRDCDSSTWGSKPRSLGQPRAQKASHPSTNEYANNQMIRPMD